MWFRKRISLSAWQAAIGCCALLALGAAGLAGANSVLRWARVDAQQMTKCEEMTRNAISAYTREGKENMSAVSRANALGAVENLSRKGLRPDSNTVVVHALLGWCKPAGSIVLRVDAYGPAPTRTDGVLVFIDNRGRTVQYIVPLEASCDPQDAPIGFFADAVNVSTETIVECGDEIAHGLIEVRHAQFLEAHPELKGKLPVPPGEVAAGLRFGDGTYATNFVPIVREEIAAHEE